MYGNFKKSHVLVVGIPSVTALLFLGKNRVAVTIKLGGEYRPYYEKYYTNRESTLRDFRRRRRGTRVSVPEDSIF
jgi:hypothetical protein